MIRRFFPIAALSVIAPLCLLGAQEELTLTQALDQALSKNFGLNISRTDALVTREEETVADAAFDPVLKASSGLSQTRSALQPSSTLSKNRVRSTEEALSLSKTLGGTGTEVEVGSTVTRSHSTSNSVDPDVTTAVEASITQPLLKGVGKVNLAPYARARARTRIAYLELEQAILALVKTTEDAYWQLATERRRYELRQSSRSLAETFLNETLERRKLGLATESDVLQAQAELATQENAMAASRKQIADAEDALAQILGNLKSSDNVAVIVPPLPENTPKVPDFSQTVERAVSHNQELRIAQENIELRRIDREVADNARLPELNWVSSGGYLGRDQRIDDAYDNGFDPNGYRWSTGVELKLPWGQRADKANYRMAQKRLNRAEEALAQARQQLIRDARQAWRTLSTGLEQLSSAQSALQYREKAYEEERARYAQGLSSFRDSLSAKRDLDNARQNALDARMNVFKAQSALGALDGSLLERHGYNWQKLDADTPAPNTTFQR